MYRYLSSGTVDALRYGSDPVDLLVLEVGNGGRAMDLEVPMVKKDAAEGG